MEMRVACISSDPGAPYGAKLGASVRVVELVDALAREGARVLALVSGVARNAARPAAGVTVEALPPSGKGASAPVRLSPELEQSAWIERRLERFGADALYERFAPWSPAGSRAAGRLGIPHLVELDAPLKAGSRRCPELMELDGAARLEREVLARAERVLAVSPPLVAHALQRGARKAEVFPGAAAIERHPRRSRRRQSRPVAVIAGRVRPWHGIETVAAAWRLMGDAAPTLVVVGDAGEASALLEQVGAVLLGPIPHRQLPAVLAEADIGLVPYARDASDHLSPLKLIEYMAAGLAVVAADLPATRDLASDDQILIVPRGDPEALAATVAGLAVDEPRRDRMGTAARALVAGAHTWRHRARRVIEHATAPAQELAPAAARELPATPEAVAT
jgi:glycosyltransferase involved in cell wall biosynthesis